MNSSTCPSCRAPIPADAPGGICPACALFGVSRPTTLLPSSQVPALDEVAAAFPDLELLGLIGQGGMGVVYKARQTRLDRMVALKILAPHLAAQPGFAERFTREARALARLSHPHIVAVFDFGESGGFFFLIMEHVDGVNLRQAMRTGIKPEQAMLLVPRICEALQFAHDRGVLHRDIKPENILLDRSGTPKLADFGIAKLAGEGVTGLTLSGAQLGTAAYMAPEQVEKPATVDHRADIYSLGVVFYEMLTGELPLGRFAAPSEKSTVGEGVDAVVMRALEKERERRQQSAGEMKTQVEGANTAPAARKLPPPLPGAAFLTWRPVRLVLTCLEELLGSMAVRILLVVCGAAGGVKLAGPRSLAGNFEKVFVLSLYALAGIAIWCLLNLWVKSAKIATAPSGTASPALPQQTTPPRRRGGGCLRTLALGFVMFFVCLLAYCSLVLHTGISILPGWTISNSAQLNQQPTVMLSTLSLSRTATETSVQWRPESWMMDTLLCLEFNGQECSRRLSSAADPRTTISLRVTPSEGNQGHRAEATFSENGTTSPPPEIPPALTVIAPGIPYSTSLCRIPPALPQIAYGQWVEIASVGGVPLRVIFRNGYAPGGPPAAVSSLRMTTAESGGVTAAGVHAGNVVYFTILSQHRLTGQQTQHSANLLTGWLDFEGRNIPFSAVSPERAVIGTREYDLVRGGRLFSLMADGSLRQHNTGPLQPPSAESLKTLLQTRPDLFR